MYRSNLWAIVAALGFAVSVSHAQSSGSNQASKGASAPQQATIGGITKLAQELKVAQMQKDLREAKRDSSTPAAPTSGPPLPGATTSAQAQPLAPGMFPPMFSQSSLSARGSTLSAPVMAPPAVAGIYGMGGKIVARLSNGQEVHAGQRVGSASGTWTVKSVTASLVTFETCGAPAPEPGQAEKKDRKGAPASTPVCQTRIVSPSGS